MFPRCSSCIWSSSFRLSMKFVQLFHPRKSSCCLCCLNCLLRTLCGTTFAAMLFSFETTAAPFDFATWCFGIPFSPVFSIALWWNKNRLVSALHFATFFNFALAFQNHCVLAWAVFKCFKKKDVVGGTPINQVWLKHINMAFHICLSSVAFSKNSNHQNSARNWSQQLNCLCGATCFVIRGVLRKTIAPWSHTCDVFDKPQIASCQIFWETCSLIEMKILSMQSFHNNSNQQPHPWSHIAPLLCVIFDTEHSACKFENKITLMNDETEVVQGVLAAASFWWLLDHFTGCWTFEGTLAWKCHACILKDKNLNQRGVAHCPLLNSNDSPTLRESFEKNSCQRGSKFRCHCIVFSVVDSDLFGFWQTITRHKEDDWFETLDGEWNEGAESGKREDTSIPHQTLWWNQNHTKTQTI